MGITLALQKGISPAPSLMKQSKPHVSIIVPVYNGEAYIQQCLESIYIQTFIDYEVIVVDDGSNDRTADILSDNKSKCKNLVIIHQNNHGQGYARNRALKQVTGTYVLFVDADDYIDPSLLSVVVSRAEDDQADVVHFDWQMLVQDLHGKYALQHQNHEKFSDKRRLTGDECELFLEKRNYYSCDSLYRKSFLDAHQIRFGEGYIYEDNEFITAVASNAHTISIANEVLYTVRHNRTSSTRTMFDTTKHYHDFMCAMRASLAALTPRTRHTSFYLAAYFLEKFIIYYQKRVPRKLRREYLHEFMNIMHDLDIVSPPGSNYRFLRSCVAYRIFAGRKYKFFYLELQYKLKFAGMVGIRRKLQQKK